MRQIQEYKANSLESFFEIVELINNKFVVCDDFESKGNNKKNKNKLEKPSLSPLWFRGQEYNYYYLFPSAFREIGIDFKSDENYTKHHLLEEYRYQVFKSRGYDHVNTAPESRIEWEEIMQHHFTYTRLMDWSESAVTSLIFALESYIDPKDDANLRYRRENCTPAVWVLSPFKLNRKVFNVITEKDEIADYMDRALSDVFADSRERMKLSRKLSKELTNNPSTYFSDYNNENRCTLSGIVGLSVLENYRQSNGYRIKELIRQNEYNMFFYMLSRYYTDGVPVSVKLKNQLPPLATLHPYHSNRIKAQRGAFTVFPYYGEGNDESENKKIRLLKTANMDIRLLEYQDGAGEYLYKIRLLNPEKIAKQLLISGSRRSSVYPELQNYSDDIESKKYHV